MIRLILFFFSRLPLRLNHFFGALIGWVLWATNSRSKRLVSDNINVFFAELSAQQKRVLIKKSLREMGKGLSELGLIWHQDFTANRTHITEIVGLEYLQNPVNNSVQNPAQSHQPTILLVPHFGCWEITGRVLSLSQPMTFLYKKFKDAQQEEFVRLMRTRADLTMLAANRKGVMALQRVLSRGGTIGILPDQDPGNSGSISAPFFAQNVRTMTLLVKLARKHKARVLLTYATRLSGGTGYRLTLKPVNVLSQSGDLSADVALMNGIIERLVRECPEQYLWNYKRF